MANTEIKLIDVTSAWKLPMSILGIAGKLIWGGVKKSQEREKIKALKKQLTETGWNLKTAKEAWYNDEINDETYAVIKSILSSD